MVWLLISLQLLSPESSINLIIKLQESQQTVGNIELGYNWKSFVNWKYFQDPTLLSPPLSCPDLELLVLVCLWSANTRLWFISYLHKLGISLKLHQKWSKSNHNYANLEYFLLQLQDQVTDKEFFWDEMMPMTVCCSGSFWGHVPTRSVSNMVMRIFPTEYQYSCPDRTNAKIVSWRIVLSDLIRDLSPVNWRRCGWSFDKTIKWSQYKN